MTTKKRKRWKTVKVSIYRNLGIAKKNQEQNGMALITSFRSFVFTTSKIKEKIHHVYIIPSL